MVSMWTDVTVILYINIFINVVNCADIAKERECSRPCTDGPRKCRYDFLVQQGAISDKNSTRSNLSINGIVPGPSLEICLGDSLEVYLFSELGSHELALHWHGIRQQNSVHMDGVPMITQCPVLPYSVFKYELKPEKVGTFFYYAHSVPQQGDGLYGSLVVRGSNDDSTLERILLISSRSSTSLTDYSQLNFRRPESIIINGKIKDVIIPVESGKSYLLRLINVNVFNCPVSFSINQHVLTVTAINANVVERLRSVTRVIMFPGERFDVRLKSNRPPGRYQIFLEGLQECRNLNSTAVLSYDNDDKSEIIEEPKTNLLPEHYSVLEKGYDCGKVSKSIACALDMKSSRNYESPKETEKIYIPFDFNDFSFIGDEMTDYNYNFYKHTYYPSYLSLMPKGVKLPQINGMSFKYPSSPILYQPENVLEELTCSLDRVAKHCKNTPLFCECLQILQVPLDKTIEVILIDEGFGGNASQTFHLHGYEPNIVGYGSFGHPISRKTVILMDEQKKLPRNLKNPPKTDTFVVPNKGYVILQLYTDNPGFWLWEARSTGISPAVLGPGLQFLMRVGNPGSHPTVPIDFPTCGNNKGIDLLFERA